MFQSLVNKIRWSYWCPSFIENNESYDLSSNLKDLSHTYRYKWFADPFIFDVNDKEIILFVEECDIINKRGRIARIIIDKSSKKMLSMKILLDLSTHLSFPAIFRFEDETYIYPENSASGNLTMYKYNKDDETLIRHSVICDDPITDAIILKLNNSYYLFGTVVPNENSNILSIYKCETFDGKYKLYQSVYFDENIARGAGDVFYREGNLYRVAQICNNGYGKGLSFQKVNFDGVNFKFEEVKRINCPTHFTGLHTFNNFNDLIVVDWRKEKHPILRRILGVLKRKTRWRN